MTKVVYKNGVLVHGDCLEVLPQIKDKSVDMILCDLPYGTTCCSWDSAIDLELLWAQYLRVAKPTTPIVLHAQTPFDKVLGSSNLEMLKYEWVWEKTSATGHLNAKKMPMKAHENILVFYSQLPIYNPIITHGHERKTAVKRKDTTEVYGTQTLGHTYDSTSRYPRSVLVFPSDKQKSNLHPTQKPVALAEYLIKTYTNPGAVVLDNCAGSGTTAVACENTGRKWCCIEKEEKYFQIIQERLK